MLGLRLLRLRFLGLGFGVEEGEERPVFRDALGEESDGFVALAELAVPSSAAE